MIGDDLIERGWQMIGQLQTRPPRGIALAFGVNAEGHQWRVSPDVSDVMWQRMVMVGNSSNPSKRIRRFFGIDVVVDDSLPPDSVILEDATDRMGRAIG